MGRKSKADELGLNQRIVDMHDGEGMTHAAVAETFRGKGYDISRESVRRSYASSARKAEKYRLAAESARKVLDGVKDGSSVDMVEAANAMVTNMFYDRIMDMEELDFKDPKDFFKALREVSRTQVDVQKFRLSFDKGVAKAKKAIYDELAGRLADNPQLLEELGAMISALEITE